MIKGVTRLYWICCFISKFIFVPTSAVGAWASHDSVLSHESGYHAVKKDEEADEVITQFDHRLLQVRLQLTAVVDFWRKG